MQATDYLDRDKLKTDIPEFNAGDTVKVHVRVVEGSRERVQIFEGTVTRRQGGGSRPRQSVQSPIISKIEVAQRGDVRRAKLYYLRDRVGKAAKIKEKRDA